ncbi:DUF6492 family protein [Shewanella fidelis]|uniref:DUF6492 family protein n=1 Tax=Shewanella fidelis TaxID=173509 RepID=A0AAW8NQE0_9GAMM|nr:DUF6492 family protein [Shewanella fidelis]MDR8524426.1 DUF6492 family protein [Shewanella fidelis]MDW4811902.1 DUF6492 family protein [Shewanella fidelis]MDW4817159.1 DUF6492 family protein [Shewanella fidelis]MDW4821229.1 DUF6492 family protein [Shewanella fidelis]MDW4822508.1 DUF6492 family protein [Shewanella fidelis]
MNKFPCVLVAEISVINTLKLAVNGLSKHSDVSRIDIIVPDNQIDDFRIVFSNMDVRVINESELISIENINKIKSELGLMSHRTGWYLQQFLKWEYAKYIDEPFYLIWDADTVLLKEYMFFNKNSPVFNLAKEYHKPYFLTIEKLIKIKKQIKSSFISQYMVIDVSLLNNLTEEISKANSEKIDWYLTVIKLLDKNNPSEFSEYETYGNYIMTLQHSSPPTLNRDKWFRYGSEILNPTVDTSLDELKKSFKGYQYVAFERHSSSFLKYISAHALRFFRV